MKETFVIALNEEDKKYLMQQGYKYISTDTLNGETIYTFLNKSDNETFSEKDRGRFLFTNIINI